MKINNIDVTARHFAYDGCHKIYLLDNKEDIEEAKSYEYDIYPIKELKKSYWYSCGLRFISGWSPEFKTYVSQFEEAVFTGKFSS